MVGIIYSARGEIYLPRSHLPPWSHHAHSPQNQSSQPLLPRAPLNVRSLTERLIRIYGAVSELKNVFREKREPERRVAHVLHSVWVMSTAGRIDSRPTDLL